MIRVHSSVRPVIRALRREDGSSPAAVLAWVGTSMAILGMLSLLGQGVLSQSRAETAADLSALAGADALAAASGEPCRVAAESASRNAAELTSCRIDGDEVVIEVAVPTGHLPPAKASARAGPEPEP